MSFSEPQCISQERLNFAEVIISMNISECSITKQHFYLSIIYLSTYRICFRSGRYLGQMSFFQCFRLLLAENQSQALKNTSFFLWHNILSQPIDQRLPHEPLNCKGAEKCDFPRAEKEKTGSMGESGTECGTLLLLVSYVNHFSPSPPSLKPIRQCYIHVTYSPLIHSETHLATPFATGKCDVLQINNNL
jgi:hypothetical protein